MKASNIAWLVIGLIILVGFIMGRLEHKKSSSSNNKALEVLRHESKIKEAIVTDANVLYVSVVDDGTRRDGYASYICEILQENGSDISLVKVVEVNTTQSPLRDNAYGVLLGESYCAGKGLK